jgi:hypothetical protein
MNAKLVMTRSRMNVAVDTREKVDELVYEGRNVADRETLTEAVGSSRLRAAAHFYGERISVRKR